MEQERAVSYYGDSDLPNGLEQKNVIIQRDRYGYGLTVSGDNPVFVLNVREGGAAQRAGVNIHDQIIKVNGTRVTHCTHVDVVNLIKSGPYAQLTLLGQPKLQTQKSVPNETQNVRVNHRPASFQADRSNSFFDTKKARDQYEKILKQLDIAKKELDRQRAKGLTHNPSRISQLENQVRQYEQQLAEIKRRLESLEPIIDPLSNKFDDTIVNRSNTFVESSSNRTGTLTHGHKKQNSLPESAVLQIMTGNPLTSSMIVNSPLQQFKRKFQNPKTETYDLVKNWDSVNTIPTDETFKFREINENEDEPSSTNIQSITTFDDIQQLINTSNWVPLTIFLNFLLTDNNSDPTQLLFYILTEELRIRKAENRNELLRWIYEIHSTFTMNPSPLFIGLPQTQIDAINRWLETPQNELTEDLKTIFTDAKDYAKSIISDRQISDFNAKKILSLNTDFNGKPQHIIEDNLRTIFEQHYKSVSIDDWNSTKNARSLALICALATYLKRCDMKKCGNIPLEKIPKFCEREQKRFMQKLQQRTTLIKKIKDHQLNEHQFQIQTLCQVCWKPLWGINCQGYLCGYCQQAFHRECVVNSEKCSKDRTKLRKFSNNRNQSIFSSTSLSGSFSADNLMSNLSSSRTFLRRSVGGSSSLFNGLMMNINGPSRTASVIEGREGSVPMDILENSPAGNEGIENSDGNLSSAEQNKTATVGRCSSDRRAGPDRPAAPKNRSSSESDNSDGGNPQMGGNTIDELLNHRSESDTLEQITNSSETLTTDGDSDLEADVNTLPNLSEFIPNETLQVLYKTREWKFQTTINELIHTERTHLKSLKIMKKCFRQPLEGFPGMSPVELDCIFRNLDQLINLHTQFKYALRQHREEAKDHVVRQIGDLILKFLDGEKGEEFAQACAFFIEDQSQALKLIKKKEQSPDFAALMRNCEANPLCRRLTLKDYLPCVMTRFTKYKMLFEAMKKFVADDPIESDKLHKCVECADNILKRMNTARLKKEQEALLKQIKANLEIQIPNDEKLQNLQDCLESLNNRLIYSGTLKLLPDLTAQKTEFECCLFNDMFVFFQKIPIQTSDQRGIEETYKYVLKEHQRDAMSGRHQRPRTAGSTNKYSAAQNFVLTPIIRLEHLLIKKKACGGARSFYVIDTDKKQLIEVEANSKDDLEKWLEWIEKARKPYPPSSINKTSSTSINRTTIAEEQSTSQPNEKESTESVYDAILSTDKELKRLLHEKEMLLSRLLNIPQDTSSSNMHSIKPNTSLEAITYATTYHNQLMQLVNQPNKTVDTQTISTPLLQLGEQLTLALKFLNQDSKSSEHDSVSMGRTSDSYTTTPSLSGIPSQIYSDLSISSLPSSESLTSVNNPFQVESSVTDLDETVKSPTLHTAHQIVEHFDVGAYDSETVGGGESQTEDEDNPNAINGDSDDEDEIEHFDQQSNLNKTYSTQPSNLELADEEVYDNLKSNDKNGSSNTSEA